MTNPSCRRRILVSYGEHDRNAGVFSLAVRFRWDVGRMTSHQSLSLVSHGWLAVVRRTLVLLGWMVVLHGLVWAAAPSDVPAYTINLSVIDEKNLPVADAKIEVRANQKLLSTFTTSATGKVTLPINAAGSYSLNIQKKGYLPTETTLEVSENTAVQDVDVVLSEAALSQQTVEVKVEASNPVTETTGSPTTLTPTTAKDTPLRPAT